MDDRRLYFSEEWFDGELEQGVETLFKKSEMGNKGMKGWLTHVRECVLTFNIRPRESSHRQLLLLFQEEGGFGEEVMGRMLVSLYFSVFSPPHLNFLCPT